MSFNPGLSEPSKIVVDRKEWSWEFSISNPR